MGTIVPEVESTGRSLRSLIEDLLGAPNHYQKNVNENITKDGQHVWISWSNRAIIDSDGLVIGGRAIGNDITTLKHAEEKLQQAHEEVQALNEELLSINQTLQERVEARTLDLRNEIEARKKAEQTYHAVFDGVNDAIFIVDGETGAHLDVNDHACELFGYTIDELQKLGVGDLTSGSGLSIKARNRDVVAEVWSTGTPQLFEWAAKDKSGRVFWVESNITRTVIGGRPCILSAVRDITERKQAEAKIIRLNRLYTVLSKTNEAMLRIREPSDCTKKRVALSSRTGCSGWRGSAEQNLTLF